MEVSFSTAVSRGLKASAEHLVELTFERDINFLSSSFHTLATWHMQSLVGRLHYMAATNALKNWLSMSLVKKALSTGLRLRDLTGTMQLESFHQTHMLWCLACCRNKFCFLHILSTCHTETWFGQLRRTRLLSDGMCFYLPFLII